MASGTAKVRAPSGLNVRKGAGTNYAKIGCLSNGTQISYLSETDGWLQINYNGSMGYVSKQYTTITSASSDGGNSGGGNAGGSDAGNASGSIKVTCDVLNVRRGAGTGYGIVGTLKRNQVVSYSAQSGGWYKIDYNGQEGWVIGTYVAKTNDNATPSDGGATQAPASAAITMYVTADCLNVRTGPGTGYGRVGSLTRGAEISVVDSSNGWHKIKYGSGTAWVSGTYTSKEKPSSGDTGGGGGGGGAISTNGVPLYAQGDPRWGKNYMGRSGCTIHQIGCAMTSTTMTLNKISGRSFTPGDMNSYLNNNGGYTSGGGIYWATAAKYVNRAYTGRNYSQAVVNDELNSGRPVVISVKSDGHWVCVAGRNADGSFIIHDPAGGVKRTGYWNSNHIKVDGYTSGYSIRTFA